jgi:hypothetical protein
MPGRNELFDLAVARALGYTQRLNLNLQDADELTKGLELWYLKTRFAYRILLEDIIKVLQTYPDKNHKWQGGKNGHWIKYSGLRRN